MQPTAEVSAVDLNEQCASVKPNEQVAQVALAKLSSGDRIISVDEWKEISEES